MPDEKTKRRIFQIHTSRMTVADDVTLDDLILAKDDLSGADIKVQGWDGKKVFVGFLSSTAGVECSPMRGGREGGRVLLLH